MYLGSSVRLAAKVQLAPDTNVVLQHSQDHTKVPGNVSVRGCGIIFVYVVLVLPVIVVVSFNRARNLGKGRSSC